MKQILLILAAFFSLNALGQIKEFKPPLLNRDFKNNSLPDTSLKIIYKNKSETKLSPAFYLNGKFMNYSVFRTLNPKIITNIRVEKQYIEVDSIKYYGKIFIETNKNFKSDYISLTDLKTKYAELKDTPTIFMIDNELINDNYDKYVLDQNYLLRINIETLENSKEGIRFNLIRILTKTEENIKKVNEIRIRGDSTLTTEYE
jgi:hypothetical protein